MSEVEIIDIATNFLLKNKYKFSPLNHEALKNFLTCQKKIKVNT